MEDSRLLSLMAVYGRWTLMRGGKLFAVLQLNNILDATVPKPNRETP